MMRPVQLRWIASVAALLLFVGCSSDSGIDTTIKQGNPNDPAFLAVKAEINDVLDSITVRSFNPLTNPWGFPLDSTTLRQDYGPFHPGDIVDYGYDNGLYTLLIGSFATAVNTMIVDSVMFLKGDIPSYWYDQYTTDIHVRSRIIITYDGEETEYTEQSYYGNIRLSGVNQQSATADGDVTWGIDYYEDTGSIQTHDCYDATVTIDGIQFDRTPTYIWGDYTPSAGIISLSVTCTNEVTDGSETTTTSRDWMFEVTISSDGTASVEVISNNTRWVYSASFGS
jgi:hypothetical protein